jgi:hypothetical protein
VEPLGRQLALLGEQRADIERLAASRRLQPAAYALGTRNQLGDALALTDVETSGQPSLLSSKTSTGAPALNHRSRAAQYQPGSSALAPA